MSIGDFFEKIDEDNNQRNFVFNFTHYLQGNSRVGASFLSGKTETYKRNIVGLNGVHPLSKKWILRSEVDYERKSLNSNGVYQDVVEALYGDHQIGYQAFKGGMAYLIFEHGQENLSDSETQINSPGIGFQFLPIPHVEFQAEYQRRVYERDSSNPEHRSFVTFHLYH